MSKKISGNNLLILIPTSLLLGASVGTSISYVWQIPFWYTFAIINGLIHIPLSLAVSDAIRQELGLRSPAEISGNWIKRPGRKITINAGENKRDIFMSLMPGNNPHEIEMLKAITVELDNEIYEILFHKLEEFIYGVARRESQGKPGLSRRYWTQHRKPKMKADEYKLMIIILKKVNGLVINRDERKSGYLSVSPKIALDLIKKTF